MFTGRSKIIKPEGKDVDEFESRVAQELFNLEVRSAYTLSACMASTTAL